MSETCSGPGAVSYRASRRPTGDAPLRRRRRPASSSKRRTAANKIADLDQIDLLITDTHPSAGFSAALEATDVAVTNEAIDGFT
ncbi:MAG: hypothetical protein QM628_18655 [Propionicimonas sp.]